MSSPPPWLPDLDESAAAARRRGAAAAGVLQGLRACGLRGPDRLTVLVIALAQEVMASAPGEETAAVEYLATAFGRLVGEDVGRRAGLAAMPPQGQA